MITYKFSCDWGRQRQRDPETNVPDCDCTGESDDEEKLPAGWQGIGYLQLCPRHSRQALTIILQGGTSWPGAHGLEAVAAKER